MSTPKRIQRKRVKGWRMPKGAVYVGRPTKWGNPFTVTSCIENGFTSSDAVARKMCADEFRQWLRHGDIGWAYGEPLRQRMLADLPELHGRDLACWCLLDGPCHADVLLELANSEIGVAL
jgi:hypothetical protein